MAHVSTERSFKHTRDRAKERLNYDLTRKEYEQLRDHIRTIKYDVYPVGYAKNKTTPYYRITLENGLEALILVGKKTRIRTIIPSYWTTYKNL